MPRDPKATVIGPLKHGHNRGQGQSRIYMIWGGMIQRCRNPKNRAFKWYGAKGITVCRRWKSFENFLKDMGPSFRAGLTLERKNRMKGYYPGNVRWATWKEQRCNRTDNRIFNFKGERLTVAQLAEKYGFNYNTLYYRLFRSNWPIDKALTTGV